MEVKSLKDKWVKVNKDFDKLSQDMFDAIKKDGKFMSYLSDCRIHDDLFIKNNVATIMSCKDDRDYCKNCPGFENCSKPHHHYIFSLNYNGKLLRMTLAPCHLKIEDNKKDEAYLVRDFKASWRSINIKNENNEIDQINRGELFKRLTDIYINLNGWIYISGVHRSGKSYMAVAVLNNLIENLHGKGAFLNYPSRVSQLQDLTYSNKQDFDDLIKMYSTVDYLVLDNFGNEYKSEYVRDAITLAILNERARRGLITIFTSEFNFDDIANMYTLNNAGKTRGKQIFNLLTNYAVKEIDISVPAGTY